MDWYISKQERRRRLLAKILSFVVLFVVALVGMFGPVIAYRLASGIPLVGHDLEYESWVIIAGGAIGGSLGSWLAYRILVIIGGYTDRAIKVMWFGKRS